MMLQDWDHGVVISYHDFGHTNEDHEGSATLQVELDLVLMNCHRAGTEAKVTAHF